MSEFIPVDELEQQVGRELGPSEWMEIDQARINLFAEATGDHQFIHVDPEMAKNTPFGTTIAHGFLSLSLLPVLEAQYSFVPVGTVMGINYGLDKVRFPMPVKVGQRVRARSRVDQVTHKEPNNWLIKKTVTIEIEGEDKPAVVAESLALCVLPV